MTISKVRALTAIILAAAACSCSGNNQAKEGEQTDTPSPVAAAIGTFNADSAYNHIARQVAFGPRVPGTDGHRKCADYIIGTLTSQGVDTLIVQTGEVKAFNGDVLPIKNIIAGFNTRNSKRVLIAAHWDTRPWAEMETNMNLRDMPIPGANDGGSGVGVLLEIARNLAIKHPSVGVDLIFFDAEDYGNADGFGTNPDSWCLGSQYWVENMTPYSADNLPVYGILLDMVGGRDARFNYEAFSAQNASTPTIKVWSEAERLGYADIFPRSIGGAATDDHVVLTRAGIPTTDIIEINNVETQTFPPTWHTHNDNMDNIDRNTLKAVGETVLNVIYKEKAF